MSRGLMPVLTLDVMHAWSVMFAQKSPENRNWRPRNPPVRFAVHAGMRFARDDDPGLDNPAYLEAMAHATEQQRNWLDVRGAIVGVVDLVDLHLGHGGSSCDLHGCFASGWGRHTTWHWVLGNPRPLSFPLPARGRQGLWTHPESEILELLR